MHMSRDVGDVVVCGVNWLGDGIMSMPALQAFKRVHSGCKISLLVKPGMEALWQMAPVVDRVLTLRKGLRGSFGAATRLREGAYGTAFVFPNSFRSALIPFLAGIGRRVGAAGHGRSLMLSEVIRPEPSADSQHQSLEYYHILGLKPDGDGGDSPCVLAGDEATVAADQLLENDGENRFIALLPGAARGPSKQWPSGHFSIAGRQLAEVSGMRVLVLGAANEAALCAEVAGAIGPAALDLSGRTNLAELASLLGRCPVTLANDSGGMHLAAAMGSKVVVVFGITDPTRTGPMGVEHRIICDETVGKSRDIAAQSIEAEKVLKSIGPERVQAAATELLSHSGS